VSRYTENKKRRGGDGREAGDGERERGWEVRENVQEKGKSHKTLYVISSSILFKKHHNTKTNFLITWSHRA
jgi:hypothetical protein